MKLRISSRARGAAAASSSQVISASFLNHVRCFLTRASVDRVISSGRSSAAASPRATAAHSR